MQQRINDFITRNQRVYTPDEFKHYERVNKLLTRVSGATITIMIGLLCSYCVINIFVK